MTLGKRVLQVTNEGIKEISTFGEMKIKWIVIDKISVTPIYCFVSINQLPSIVIPKDKVKENFDDFVQVCRKFQEENFCIGCSVVRADTRTGSDGRNSKRFAAGQRKYTLTRAHTRGLRSLAPRATFLQPSREVIATTGDMM